MKRTPVDHDNHNSPVDVSRPETTRRKVIDGHHDDDGRHGNDRQLRAEVDENERT